MNWDTAIALALGIATGLALLVLLASLACFLRVFYSPKRKVLGENEYELPRGRVYEPYHEQMRGWMKQIRTLPHEDMEITSFDGLTLRGKYYHYRDGAPIEILFHGYRGNSERDLCGSVERCFALERNALIVDQRAGGRSDGHIITFGVRERLDVLRWVDHVISRFGGDVKIILTGISMGASTVILASAEPLPDNVKCILADCGYSSAKEIICKVVQKIGLRVKIVYPLIRLGARLYGHFDPEDASPIDTIRQTKIPVILIHGETDDFVPWEMGRDMFEACGSEKKFVSVPNAGHGVAYMADIEGYLRAVREFDEVCGL